MLLLALLRHLWLATYVHPYGDDLSYAVAGLRFPLMERLLREYDSWNGRYFSNLLVLRNPMVLGLEGGLSLYRLAPVALMLLTVGGAYALVRAVCGKLLRWDTYLTIALAFTLLFLHVMPDANEGFYWYTGAVTYQLPNALSLFLLANWVWIFRNAHKGTSSWIIAVQVVLVLVIAGCNEVHMAFLLLGHAGLLLMRHRSMGSWDMPVLAVFLASAVCAAVVILAPGNENRGDQFTMGHEFLHTAIYSAAQTARFIGTWVFLSPLILLTFLIPGGARWLSDRSSAMHRLFAMDRWLALALPFAVVLLPMVVTYWPTGLLGQYRTTNVACFYFLPLYVLAVAVWDQQVFRTRWTTPPAPDGIRGRMYMLVLCAVALFTGRDAALNEDLISGRAARYDLGISERHALVVNAIRSGAEAVEVPYVEAPSSLHILPLDSSPDHWMNRSLADHHGKPQLDITVAGSPGSPR